MKATIIRVIKAPKIRKETPRQAAEREAAERLMADGARCRREERITGAPPSHLAPMHLKAKECNYWLAGYARELKNEGA